MNRILMNLLQSSRSAVLRFTRGAPSHQIPSRKRLKSLDRIISSTSLAAAGLTPQGCVQTILAAQGSYRDYSSGF